MRIEWWKFIPGYGFNYMVSDKGRVLSLNYHRTGKTKILKPSKNKKTGYMVVTMYIDGQKRTPYVHRLVAIAFIPNPHNYPEINHVDENKENNCVENLEWCDRKYNTNYGTRNERMSYSKSEPVIQYTLDGKFVDRYLSESKAAELNINAFQEGISACCKGKQKTHAGFIWKYENRDFE